MGSDSTALVLTALTCSTYWLLCWAWWCRSLKLPPMLGYLAAGVLIGPHALALAQNSRYAISASSGGVSDVRHRKEFSLPVARHAPPGIGWLMQVFSMLVLAALALAHLGAGVGDVVGLALSGVLAMSARPSSSLMAERPSSASMARVMGILLFQDLAVPLLVLIPALGSSPDAC